MGGRRPKPATQSPREDGQMGRKIALRTEKASETRLYIRGAVKGESNRNSGDSSDRVKRGAKMRRDRGRNPSIDKRPMHGAQKCRVRGPTSMNPGKGGRALSGGAPEGAQGGRKSEVSEGSELHREKKVAKAD